MNMLSVHLTYRNYSKVKEMIRQCKLLGDWEILEHVLETTCHTVYLRTRDKVKEKMDKINYRLGFEMREVIKKNRYMAKCLTVKSTYNYKNVIELYSSKTIGYIAYALEISYVATQYDKFELVKYCKQGIIEWAEEDSNEDLEDKFIELMHDNELGIKCNVYLYGYTSGNESGQHYPIGVKLDVDIRLASDIDDKSLENAALDILKTIVNNQGSSKSDKCEVTEQLYEKYVDGMGLAFSINSGDFLEHRIKQEAKSRLDVLSILVNEAVDKILGINEGTNKNKV